MIWFIVGTVLAIIGYKAYANTKKVNIKNIELKRSGSPEQSLHVLHLSDMHLENISITPAQLYEKLKGEQIDLIAITGDFIDRKRTIPKLIRYLKVLNQLQPRYGIYAVFGNHDYVLKGENFTALKKILEDYHCTTLQNENCIVNIKGHPVNIIGIDDYSTNRSDINSSYNKIKKGYNLVLTHDPNVVLEMKDYPFDYLLSGHFHGGQLLYPKAYHLVKMGKLAKMKMIKGFHRYHGKPFYISEGLGQTGLNIRIGCRPEITIHSLPVVKEKQKEKVS
ncbi:metallophosphoesterase [Salibacterium aidingense]|uniref:metallophosphoesterase n=1 Tax=Salibacterium aidingense TaxID=384933 RepID=UPI0004059944|nr:metallophosphoesterase [Salibacterium aidingense]